MYQARERGNKETPEGIRKGEGAEGYFKKSLDRILQTRQMKYKFMAEHRELYKLKSMCEVLKVSRSGYYAWSTRQPSIRQKANEELLERIRKVHSQSRRLYGSPRITAELNEEGVRCGKNRVARIMKDN